jgi:predicted enzyme related to lactoylglutathione lyase
MTPKAASAKGRKATSFFKDAKAFSSFSVKDLKQAKQFYGETLGIDVSETPEGLELNLANSNNVFLYPKPNHTPASFTVLNFPVDDIDEAVGELEGLGIKLERYNTPDIKTDERGIMRGPDGPHIAWFKDPFGNILSVLEDKR